MNIKSSQLSLQDFVADLRRIPKEWFSKINFIKDFLMDHPIDPVTLQPYLFWDRRHYTRNLVDKRAQYELIAICWEVGQRSSIHNHQGQNCWMAVPIGRLMVQNYRILHHDSKAGRCNLEMTETIEMDPANPVGVNPDEPVHKVFNPIEFNIRAVSLHIYSHPFDSCTVYSEDCKTYEDIKLSYTSEYGVRKMSRPK